MKKIIYLCTLLLTITAAAQSSNLTYNLSRTTKNGITNDWQVDLVRVEYYSRTVVATFDDGTIMDFTQTSPTETGVTNDGQYYHAALFTVGEERTEVVIQKMDEVIYARFIFDAENYIELVYVQEDDF